ncbi:MAG TPA: SIS domain-containing protein, partial [Thermoanaerobaculia bacterium]|nr:SIS domain-containing protein [Thermoanaerobaculia bacterium]
AIGSRSWSNPFQAMSLTDNVPIMTAIANDYGYEQVFVLQLKTLAAAGDVIVAISASGNSPNVLRAIEWGNEIGAITVGLTGFDGGELRRLAQIAVHVPTSKGEYGPVEDIHMVLDHLIGSFLMHHCLSEARTLSDAPTV